MALYAGFLVVASVLFHSTLAELPSASNETKAFENTEWKNPVGRLCMTVEHFKAIARDNSSFYECATLTEGERRDYGIEGKYLGLWTKRSCSNDSLFDVAKQRCIEKKRYHRQQALCANNPSSLSCQYACAIPIVAYPQIGFPCAWQRSRLYNDPTSNRGFLQCVATSAADPCGKWESVDCPAFTSFELTIQICTPTLIQKQEVVSRSCAASNEIAVCRCGSATSSCPGISVCQNGYCCATVDPALVPSIDPTRFPQAQAPTCIGSGAYPISSCSIPCPPQYTCQPSVGCCPVVLVPSAPAPTTQAPTTQAAKMILVQLTTCPGTNTPPISSCGSCPTGYSCAPLLGACCPAPPPPPPTTTPAPAPQQVIILCPKTNTPPVANCNPCPAPNCNPCPPQFVCTPIGCCPSAPPSTTTAAPSPQYVLCPVSNSKPVSSCPCPPSYFCVPSIQACCPAPTTQAPTTTAAPQYVLLCPGTNEPPQSSCPCAPNMVCTPIGCCGPSATPAPATTVAPQFILLCPGSNTAPQSCNSCQPPNVCMPIGCCPPPAPPPTTQPPPSPVQIMLCSSGTPPVQQCAPPPANPCPPSYICATLLGCCPAPTTTTQAPATSAIPATLYLVCPTGSPPTQECAPANPCPPMTSCIQGACCPCQCPPMSFPVNVCPAQSPAPTSVPVCICTNGCCCQQAPVPQLPTCSNGQIAVLACTASNQCGAGQECSAGGCCPIPYCPSGQQAAGHCSVPATNVCQVGTICLDGLCCALPQCSSGQTASSFCTSDSGCGANQQCVNGGCCSVPPIPIPLCPSGVLALVPCAPTCSAPSAPDCCPASTQCVVGVGCCPQPAPQPPPQQLPICPTSAQALTRCNNGCPPKTTCTNNLCCPVQTVPVVQVPTVPVCVSTGQVASSFCGPDHTCPTNYGCTPEGGCCQLVTDIVCPMQSLPVCLCSPTNNCPDGSACFNGMCCATPTVYTAMPGTGCEVSPQCAGSGAQCLQNLCICIKGSYSNGASCVVQQPMIIQLAQNGCDQYGSPCNYVLSSVRRRPVLSALKKNATKPLWYNVVEKRRCLQNLNETEFDPDHTCLPNEKCIDGVCKPKLWLGEYGCDSDLQCKARCPNSYCEKKSDKNVPQCQCTNGLLLYGRCFDTCPKGFHESGGYCRHDDEDAFWQNSETQVNLQSLLNKGSC